MGISKKLILGLQETAEETFLYILSINKNGMEAAVSNFGAILVQLIVPNKDGERREMWYWVLIIW